MTFDDSSLLRPIFEELFANEVDQKIVRHFGSEYLIYSFTIARTLAKEAQRRAFLWHCDRGPKRFLKILVYLNGTEVHGGTTEFIDRSSTAGFERIGYVFGPNKRRVADLDLIAKRHDLRFEPTHPLFKAGEGLLFEPSAVLHRGFMPTLGERYLISLMLLPSSVPWREAYDCAARSRFCERNCAAWIGNADDIARTMGLELPRGTVFALPNRPS